MKYLVVIVLLLTLNGNVQAQYDIMDSGGKLNPEQHAFNTSYYDLNIQVFPDQKRISGQTIVHARVDRSIDRILLDFDTLFTIHSVALTSPENIVVASYEMPDGLLRIYPERTLKRGEQFIVEITYEGIPRIAKNPPWDGGFTWSSTKSGEPFIGVSCQGNGANIWWPNKDHPSDRPDSVSISIRVPDHLIAASNGKSRGETQHNDSTKTFHWHVSTPINPYAVSMNIAPYEVIERAFESITGELVPVYFWALPENREKAEVLLEDVERQFQHFEKLLGPYPFRADKYGIAEAPYFGMEHQTLIAYGAGYKNDTVFDTGSGFDDLHHHELAHEWWGNLVAADDWKDFWLHEGFGTYMQPLYAEYLHGQEQYRHFMNMIKKRIQNDYAIAPETTKTVSEMFRGRDVYMKGAWVLHMLRYQMGDEVFFEALRRFAYPTEESESVTDGRQSRHASTNEFIAHVEEFTPDIPSEFFEVYLRQPHLPVLQVERERRTLRLWWEAPGGESFKMPVEVRINGEKQQLDVGTDPTSIRIRRRAEVEIDPDGWLLFDYGDNQSDRK